MHDSPLLLGAVAGASLSFALCVFVFRRLGNQRSEPAFLSLQQQMQAEVRLELQTVRSELATALRDNSSRSQEQLALFSQSLGERMRETSATLHNTQSSVGQRLDSAAQAVGQLHQKLGALDESAKRIFEIGQGMQELKDILKSPKLRGNMGEFFLEDLLRQILPSGHFSMQHAFRGGEVVDAAIQLGSSIIPVDSKFPLESFVRLSQLGGETAEAKREKRAFATAIRRHADSIARKYIRPDEGTYDFALMYIPAENVYYETIIRDEGVEDGGDSLHSYLLQKKVVPVSPNSLYAYLQVIVLGLRGFKVQEHARQLTQGLQRLENELGRFREEYGVLGRHLRNAAGAYDESHKRLDKYESAMTMLLEPALEKPAVLGASGDA